MSVNATQGDRISGETILTLADISQPLVKVYLDESDLDHLQVGNKAEIVLDAFPNRSYTGQVVEINRSLADLDGVDMAEGLVLMDEVPSNNSQSLPTGLTATVDIISAQVDNAVLVPLEALHETGTGEYVVYVIQGEQVEARPVSIGISDYTTVEITEGLAAGEAVALGELPNLKGEQ
jgi:multidrug efflux pump subunit AcrA (membrane-fusion protein)